MSGRSRGRGGDGRSRRSTRGGSGRGAERRGTGRRPPSGGRGQRGTTPRRPDGGGRRELGGDQVEGRQAVRELLLVGRRRVREVLLAADLDPAPVLDAIIDLADEAKVPIREVSRRRFDALSRTEAAQGVLALAAPLQPVPLEDLVEPHEGRAPFLLVLDGLTDPGNVGAILRTAEAAGVTGVVFPRHRSAHITPTVAKAAAGAIEHLRMAVVPGIAGALPVLARHGIWTVGLDAAGPTPVHELTVADEPVALVVGAEGRGLSRLVRRRCDTVASIPIVGTVESLNASVAAAVALYEIVRRRR